MRIKYTVLLLLYYSVFLSTVTPKYLYQAYEILLQDGFCPSKTIPKNLDPSYEMDLDFWGLFPILCFPSYEMDLDFWGLFPILCFPSYEMDLDFWGLFPILCFPSYEMDLDFWGLFSKGQIPSLITE